MSHFYACGQRSYPILGILIIVFGLILSVAIAFGTTQETPHNPFADYEAFLPGNSIWEVSTVPGCFLEFESSYYRYRYFTCRNAGAWRWIFIAAPGDIITYASFYPAGHMESGWLWHWFESCTELRHTKWSRTIQCGDGMQASIVMRRRFRLYPTSKFSAVMNVRFWEPEK